MRKRFINSINRLLYIKDLCNQKELFDKNSCHPPGHFYSPIVDVEDIKDGQEEIWSKEFINTIDGIDLREDDQLKLVRSFQQYYDELPFEDDKNEVLRYYYNNEYYHHTDAIFLYSVMRKLAPCFHTIYMFVMEMFLIPCRYAVNISGLIYG